MSVGTTAVDSYLCLPLGLRYFAGEGWFATGVVECCLLPSWLCVFGEGISLVVVRQSHHSVEFYHATAASSSHVEVYSGGSL